MESFNALLSKKKPQKHSSYEFSCYLCCYTLVYLDSKKSNATCEHRVAGLSETERHIPFSSTFVSNVDGKQEQNFEGGLGKLVQKSLQLKCRVCIAPHWFCFLLFRLCRVFVPRGRGLPLSFVLFVLLLFSVFFWL